MNGIESQFSKSILNELNKILSDSKKDVKANETSLAPKEGKTFQDHLMNSLNELDVQLKDADTQANEVSAGKSSNIHEAMLAATKSQLSFQFMVQVRNKCLEAYQEVMRMQV